jgi:hypothetical protein
MDIQSITIIFKDGSTVNFEGNLLATLGSLLKDKMTGKLSNQEIERLIEIAASTTEELADKYAELFPEETLSEINKYFTVPF